MNNRRTGEHLHMPSSRGDGTPNNPGNIKSAKEIFAKVCAEHDAQQAKTPDTKAALKYWSDRAFAADDEITRLRAKCAHCPAPAVIDITLGDPINYSLCQRCADLEEHTHDGCSPASGDGK